MYENYDHQAYIEANKQPINPTNPWRLPTVPELVAAWDYELGAPVVSGFNSNYYWSSATHASNSSSAWYVYFRSGIVRSSSKTDNYYVRCVRAGQDGLEWSKKSKTPMSWDMAVLYCKQLNKGLK